MTAAPPLVFPGSRTLAGWWKDLAGSPPQRLWVGHLVIHRLEALIQINQVRPLDPVLGFALEAASLRSPCTSEEIESVLRLPRPILVRLLHQLAQRSLVSRESDDTWRVTPRGSEALVHGCYSHPSRERRPFHFLEPTTPEGDYQFLAWRHSAPCAQAVPTSSRASLTGELEKCICQSESWKDRHQFPSDIQGLIDTLSGDLSPGEIWERLPVHRCERVPLVLVERVDQKGSRLVGLVFQPDGWKLRLDPPAFELGPVWPTVFPELTGDLPLEEWSKAWQEWCRPRSIPMADVQSVVLSRDRYRLRVMASGRLIERLQASRSDAVRNEAWVLAGSGRLKAAALLELLPQR